MFGPDITIDDRDMFRDLLYITALRGTDSTGVFLGDLSAKKERLFLQKSANSAQDFISADSYQKWPLLKGYGYDIYMGHCRDATVGKITDQNAHPYDVGNLIGCHNGTLWEPRFRNGSKTDSELLLEEMDKDGVMKTLETITPSSAFSIAIYEKDSKKITLTRNKKRPLWIGVNKKRNVIYWSSEELMMRLAAERDGKGIELDIYYAIPDHVYEIDLYKIKKNSTSFLEGKEIKYKPVPSYYSPVSTTSTATGSLMTYQDGTMPLKNKPGTSISVGDTGLETDYDWSRWAKENGAKDADVPRFLKDKPKKPVEDDDLWVECCICYTKLEGSKLDESQCIHVQGSDYYTCKPCEDDITSRAAEGMKRRKPEIDPTVEKELETH